MAALPSGTVTFLFTDIEGSTRRWDAQPEAMRHALARHDAILRDVIEGRGGYVFKTVGDAFHAAFATAPDALRAAVEGQRALAAEGWGEAVRMALHTGSADERDGDYFGPPLNHLARLREAGHGGQVLLSGITAELVRDRLPEGVQLRDLGEHRLRDVERPMRVHQLAVWGLPADFPSMLSDGEHLTNLPTPITSFVGREREVEEIARLLEHARLVTLTGPGGTGKTRLALTAAACVQDAYADGVWFVDLSPVTDPALVASTIAQTIGIREAEGRPIAEILTAYLREKRSLLLLDNLEQLVDAAPLLGDLLATATRLTLLVTSRVLLRLAGEREYAVPPLPLPDPTGTTDPESLAESAAVALFVQRARDASAGFVLTGENAATVADICARLDGLPLALELAAARLRVLTPEALRERLDRRLKLLTVGTRNVPRRQQSLRDAIAWSYDLLTPEEQTLLRRLSVFTGGWTLAAAEAVCDGEGDLRLDIVDGLGSLVEKSLVRRADDSGGEPRYAMLATIREFGLEHLEAGGEADTLRRRHAAFMLRLMEGFWPTHTRAPSETDLARVAADEGNLRAALGWALNSGDAALGLGLVGASWLFWMFRGAYREMLDWARALLDLPGASAPTPERARAQFAGAWAGAMLGDYTTAGPLAQASLDTWRAVGGAGRHYALALTMPGRFGAGQRADVQRAADEAVALMRATEDRAGLAMVLHCASLNYAGILGDVATARRQREEALDIYQEVGERRLLALALGQQARLEQLDGSHEASERHWTESLALCRAVGDAWGTAGALSGLGALALERGDVAAATARFAEAAHLAEEYGLAQRLDEALRDLAEALAQSGCVAAAVRLYGTAAAQRESRGMVLPPVSQDTHTRQLDEARAALGEDAFATASAEGRALSVDEAVALALVQTTAPETDAGSG